MQQTDNVATAVKLGALASLAAAATFYIWKRSQLRAQELFAQQQPGSPFTSASSDWSRFSSLVSISDWRDALPDNVQLCKQADGSLEILGGVNGKVYKGIQDGATPVAVKVFAAKGLPANTQADLDTLKQHPHPNLVRVYACCFGRHQTLLVHEFVDGGNLYQKLHCSEGSQLLWYLRRKGGAGGSPVAGHGKHILLGIARGLADLHSHGFVHRDLQSRSILLAADYTAKIGDAIQAPEVLLGQQSNEKVDVWSFGVILWEVVTGEKPRRGSMRPVRPGEECPAAIGNLIQRCMASNPDNRPTAADIVESISSDDLAHASLHP